MSVEPDEPDGPDVLLDGDPDDVEWLEHADEDEVDSGPGALPAPATRRRVVGSLLLAGAVLAATGYAAGGVYHRDRTADLVADAAADELILAAPTSGGISLPGLGSLSPAAAARSGRLSTEIAVPLVNRGPAAVTLLPGATLLGPGLTTSHLGGGSAVVLAPGQSIVLRGSVTVDCAASPAGRGPTAGTSLTVSARTSGGGFGVGTVTFEGSAAGSVRDRVCAARDGG